MVFLIGVSSFGRCITAEANDSIEQGPLWDSVQDRVIRDWKNRDDARSGKTDAINRNAFIKSYQTVMGNAPKRMTVNVEIANLYSGPGTNYELQWQAEKYFPVLIFIKGSNWYRIVDFAGDMAWIDKSFLGEINGIITISECYVYSLPKNDNQALFAVEQGVAFKVLNRSGDWLKIEHSEGSIGWIEKRYVW